MTRGRRIHGPNGAIGLVTLVGLLAPAAWAADPCADMIRLQGEHAAHIAAQDSDPATLNRLLDATRKALDDCLARTDIHESEDFKTARAALERPRYAVPESAITWSEAELTDRKDAYRYFLYVQLPGGQGRYEWGLVTMPCEMLDGKCFPTEDESPDMCIDTRIEVGGRDVVVHIVGQENKRVGATSLALRVLHQQYQKVFGARLARLAGSLEHDNLTHFQKEWAEAVYKQRRSRAEANQIAIRAVSFGKARMKPPFNYRRFDVDADTLVEKRLKLTGDATEQPYQVPDPVDVVASERHD